MNKASHTPLPWRYENNGSGRDWIYDARENIVVESVGYLDGPFIVRAANSHAELEAALRECAAIVRLQNGNRHADINEILARADATLAKAKAP
jgi:hypothetical protein